MRYTRVASIALLATAVAVVAAPGTAGAHDQRFDGKVTIRENPDFHGRVTSSKAACEKDRKVKIYREQSGPDGLLASTRTDDDGRWEYLAGQLTGDFYAKIRRTDVGPQGHDHVCKGDRSKSVSVQAPPPP
jgi:hypothetical protein